MIVTTTKNIIHTNILLYLLLKGNNYTQLHRITYSCYIDIRIINPQLLKSLRLHLKLACNLQVLSYDMKYLIECPTEYNAEMFVKKNNCYNQIYDNLHSF